MCSLYRYKIIHIPYYLINRNIWVLLGYVYFGIICPNKIYYLIHQTAIFCFCDNENTWGSHPVAPVEKAEVTWKVRKVALEQHDFSQPPFGDPGKEQNFEPRFCGICYVPVLFTTSGADPIQKNNGAKRNLMLLYDTILIA